ncbi:MULTISPECIES: LysM peptidoglycan-binding domain-containing protein [Pseudomonas]|uniref:LysM peptidoglycan-binding domain-containing protein n=1 Tax=Pseudomonas gingeri TaxID=117681 RepID=A0A7Y8BLU1_9PSED|nr:MULTISPECIES: LysM peptidoglycan-binding domain-containing protein [Pseudomonas]MBV6752939.1 LysM peptidoglycan-binding domain-containing protein [Pseudomonas chlororaphis]MCU1740083.1 LysM peptidoglycan-binding domain-containing protein [Pseudomonas sp. 20S_6.2_Bac1]NWB48402.1 LysM peptidoglycan-binding domain-containing protein [Pseudomonas gingeri]
MNLLDTLKSLFHSHPAADKPPPDSRWQVPPVEDPLAPTAPLFDTYTVQPGDTLGEIARRQLNDEGRWPEIAEANRATVPDPDRIEPGQQLKIPR